MYAQFYLAACYEIGVGVAKDYLEARRLYTLASAQHLTTATQNLTLLEEKIRTECLLLGKQVMIAGTSRVGVARSFNEATGRYVVKLHRSRGSHPPAMPQDTRR